MTGPLVTINNIEKALHEITEKAVARPSRLSYTPLLPYVWPPSGDPTILAFVYISHPTKTGLRQSVIFSPLLRIKVDVSKEDVNILNVDHLDSVRLRNLQPWPMERISPNELRAGSEALLRAVNTEEPEQKDMLMIHHIYGRWMAENKILAENLKQYIPAFINWLDE